MTILVAVIVNLCLEGKKMEVPHYCFESYTFFFFCYILVSWIYLFIFININLQYLIYYNYSFVFFSIIFNEFILIL
jgi:hypothetical protein